MIDTFSILFTTVMILVVVVRAVRLDRTLPWFDARPEDGVTARPAATPAAVRPGARGLEGRAAGAGRPRPPASRPRG